MNKTPLTIALVLVLALGVATPTIGASSKTLALETAREALRTAKQAARIGETGKRRARKALDLARSSRVASATAPGAVSTGVASSYQDLGGPEVSVAVPDSGLIDVWAQATIVDDGAVAVFEDGARLAGQAAECDGPGGGLLSVGAAGQALRLATPSGQPLAFCGSVGPPAPVQFSTSPGRHSYELRYADCGCDPATASFRDRVLRVAPRP